MSKILVVTTSRKTRGGISSVVKAHEIGWQWKEFHCKWLETHRDGGLWIKLWYLIKSFSVYLFLLPFYDIVHFHCSETPSALRKCMFMWWAKMWKKKTIVHFHAFSPETTIESKYKVLYKYLFGRADRVVVLSGFWRQSVNKVFHLSDKVVVLYNPCIAEISDTSYSSQKHILYAGTVNARKGYAVLIKAFALIALKYPEWKIVFAGNGEVEHGRALAKELGIEEQTIFLGWVNGDAKDKAFKEASVFCLPSYAEGFPMAVLDAWAYGLPVITTPVGGIPDIARDGENLLLFQPGDIEALGMQLEKMMADETLRTKIAKESCRLAATTFNLATINEQLGVLYERLSRKS